MRRKSNKSASKPWRIRILYFFGLVFYLLLILRLWYWQFFQGRHLLMGSSDQYLRREKIEANRGEILSSDHYPLVTNELFFTPYIYTPDIIESSHTVASQLAPLFIPYVKEYSATLSAQIIQSMTSSLTQDLTTKFDSDHISWVKLAPKISLVEKEKFAAFKIPGMGFDPLNVRIYPEGSMAAQLLGFVGKDDLGQSQGYFGLEGYYHLELTGEPGYIKEDKDLGNRPILGGEYQSLSPKDGRTIITHLDRALQFIVERELQKGLDLYQAQAGEVIIMEPNTGAIKVMASLPGFDPSVFAEVDPSLYKLPSIADTYEPGSTFKVITMAAALNENRVKPETVCAEPCQGPVTIGAYTIRTWNNEYHPGQTLTDVLTRSDNIGMIFVSQKLGQTKFIDYIKAFGFGEKTGIDLEGEQQAPLRKRWGDIDLATGSFGQGIAVTSIQMVTAVNAIASQGVLYTPQVVQAVKNGSDILPIKPRAVRQVLSPTAVAQITKMMVESATHGEAQWAAIKDYQIAGKTGTAQIPISGHYDAEKTIATFVGFAPASNPQFTMIVKLKEPQASPWAAETAAPLWFNLAKIILDRSKLVQ